MAKGFSFGEECFDRNLKDQVLANDISLDCDGVIAFIDFDTFFSKIGGSWEVALKKSEKSHEFTLISKSGDAPKEVSQEIRCADMKIEEMISIKKLGLFKI